ncbi:MAG TPA: hypothetical protein VGQ42_10980 [Candidatus Dormibacteraeota bacterium]|jgi:hypothetical protein|nr:hypothetical protein [Candidatus Dormibacteraeota bacterium]
MPAEHVEAGAGEVYEVLWPLGPSTAQEVELSARPADLSGRRIGFVWDYVFRGDEIFAQMQRALSERYPMATFASYESFGNVHGKGEEEVLEALPERLRAERVDAVIIGVGA